MNATIFQLCTLTAACIAAPLVAGAGPISWRGEASDQSFTTAGNWSNGKTPAGKGSDVVLEGNHRVTLDGETSFGRLTLGDGVNLDIVGGSHYRSRSGKKVRDVYFSGSSGTVNHIAGTHRVGHLLLIGSGDLRQGGTYNLEGGRLWISRAGNTRLGTDTKIENTSLQIGDKDSHNTAALNISGEAELTTRAGVVLGSTGTFRVIGSQATLDIGGDREDDGAWTQLSGSTLAFVLDEQGASTVKIKNSDGKPGVDVRFDPNTQLEVSFAPGVTPFPGSWVLFESENTLFTASTLANITLVATDGDPNWTFGYENRNGHGRIVLDYQNGGLAFEPH